MFRDSRGRFTSAPVKVEAPPLLTYPYLSSLAVEPGPNPSGADSLSRHHGDYRDSPLGPEVGLHIHTDTDGWFETEEDAPVHFIVQNSKIMVVHPEYLEVRYENAYMSDRQHEWTDRVRRDHEAAGLEIRMSQYW